MPAVTEPGNVEYRGMMFSLYSCACMVAMSALLLYVCDGLFGVTGPLMRYKSSIEL
jgi:hypothetical protein